MKVAEVHGITLEYEVVGSGEPVLLVSPLLADGFLPLLSEPALAQSYRLIRYHKRGWAGSMRVPGPVSVADHVADAAALLVHLGVERAHVVGHGSGGSVALQLAVDHPAVVQTLSLLEPTLLSVPSGNAFFAQAQPALDAYHAGRPEAALASFLAIVSGLAWDACRALLDERLPGTLAQTIADADTFFAIELPGTAAWSFGAELAAGIRHPVLSVLGAETLPLSVDVAERLRSWLPVVEEHTVDDAGHFLHIQRPAAVARAIAGFLGRHRLGAASKGSA